MYEFRVMLVCLLKLSLFMIHNIALAYFKICQFVAHYKSEMFLFFCTGPRCHWLR
jgi:hypothetical protein